MSEKKRFEMMDPEDLGLSEWNVKREDISIADLRGNIREMGVIEPLIVRKEGDDYKIIAGHRRWTATLGTGLKVPCIVVDWDNEKAAFASLSENLDVFRKDLDDYERAKALQRIKNHFGLSNAEIGKKLGVTRATIKEWMELVRPEYEGVDVEEVQSTTAREVRGGLESLGAKKEDVGRDTIWTIQKARNAGITEKGIRRKVIPKAKKIQKAEPSLSHEEAVDRAVEETKPPKDETKIHVDITFYGNVGGAVKKIADDRVTTPEDIVRQATERFLQEEGYLSH